jgi:hypothetical protein
VRDGKRQCTQCGEWYPGTLEFFHSDAQKRDGISSRCKQCDYAGLKRWRHDNPDKQKAKARRERLKDPERRREMGRVYLRKHPERGKVRYQRRQARKRGLPDTLTREEWAFSLDYFNDCCAVCSRPRGLWHTIAADHWIPITDADCPGTVAANIIPLCHGIEGCNQSKSNRAAADWLTERYGKRRAKQIIARIEAYFEAVRQ